MGLAPQAGPDYSGPDFLMNSEEQWELIGDCECGAWIFRMGDEIKRPNCICNNPVDISIPMNKVPELTDDMPDLDYVIKKLELTRKLIKPLTRVQRISVQILAELIRKEI